METIKNIVRSGAFMNFPYGSTEPVLVKHYLGALVKLACYLVLVWCAMTFFKGFSEAQVPMDDYEVTYPF